MSNYVYIFTEDAEWECRDSAFVDRNVQETADRFFRINPDQETYNIAIIDFENKKARFFTFNMKRELTVTED